MTVKIPQRDRDEKKLLEEIKCTCEDAYVAAYLTVNGWMILLKVTSTAR